MAVPTFASSVPKAVSLLPFGYFAITRLPTLKDYAYLVATSWVPAAWFLYRSSGLSVTEVMLVFAAGYLAFIASYEIGYFVNDSWDAKRSAGGRDRIPFSLGPSYIALFLTVRITLWVTISVLCGWLFDPVWIAGFVVLAAAFAQHNLISASGLRGASFFQLATLRFVLPIIAATPAENRLLLVVSAIIFYTYFRLLSYFESKDLARIPERRRSDFGLIQLAMLIPLCLFVGLVSQSTLVIELLAYFLTLHGVWFVALTARSFGYASSA